MYISLSARFIRSLRLLASCGYRAAPILAFPFPLTPVTALWIDFKKLIESLGFQLAVMIMANSSPPSRATKNSLFLLSHAFLVILVSLFAVCLRYLSPKLCP